MSGLSPRTLIVLKRALAAILVLCLAALAGAGVLIATRDYAAIERDVIARIEQSTGASLRFDSRRQILWPKPKIVFENVSFARADGQIAVRARQVYLGFELRDLLDGTVDGPALLLVEPIIEIRNGPLDHHLRSPRAMTDFVDTISAAFGGNSAFKRLTINVQNGTVVFEDGKSAGNPLTLSAIDGQLRYSSRKGRVDAFARQTLAAPPFDAAFSLPTREVLGASRPRQASFSVSLAGSRIAFAGTARRDPDMALVGRMEISLSDTLERRLLNLSVSSPLELEPTVLAATMMLDPRGIGLEQLVVSRAGKQLAGIAALREINGRWGISATLAGNLVDGASASAALRALRGTDGAWSKARLAANPLPGIDLDIRLSTKEFRLGNLVLANSALSVLTRQGRAEFAIVDSRFGAGTLKARVSLVEAPDAAQDLKLMLSGDRVEIGQLFEKSFAFSGLSGAGNFVLQVEGRGASVADLSGNLAGSGALELRAGELVGIDLDRLLARSTDARPEAALVGALGGKTPFELLRVNISLRDGRIEPVGSTFVSAKVSAILEGGTGLLQQRHALAIILKRRVEVPGLPDEFYAFKLDGPLFSPRIRPDLGLLTKG